MQSKEKFSLLRSILKAIGLSQEAVDDVVDWIIDLLTDKEEDSKGKKEYPYATRRDFLSTAEHSFFMVLKNVVGDSAFISTKVSLGDLFYVKASDASKFRTYTNKIDRKHVDFLLCDAKTVKPILGIELDDKSHQRSDRQVRDEFVEHVFAAAHLPLLRVPVKPSYSTIQLARLLDAYLKPAQTKPVEIIVEEKEDTALRCPKCGGEMVLRTAKSGPNQGGKFWGCKSYPNCRGIVTYNGADVAR